MEEEDIYVHPNFSGAPHFIIKGLRNKIQEKELFEDILQFTATAAVIFSKAWKEKLYNTEVYWVFPEQVSKTPPSGQYLSKGAFIISGKRNYIQPKEMALGIRKNPLQIWPLSWMKNPIATLRPGNLEKSEIAKKLSKILQIPTDDLMLLLPNGKTDLELKIEPQNQKQQREK
jgi:hypothetical protein